MVLLDPNTTTNADLLKECSENCNLKDHPNLPQKGGHLDIEIDFTTEHICPPVCGKLKINRLRERLVFLATLRIIFTFFIQMKNSEDTMVTADVFSQRGCTETATTQLLRIFS